MISVLRFVCVSELNTKVGHIAADVPASRPISAGRLEGSTFHNTRAGTHTHNPRRHTHTQFCNLRDHPRLAVMSNGFIKLHIANCAIVSQYIFFL